MVFVLAAVLAASNVGRGLARAREPGALGDLATRAAEYELFRAGVYPNGAIAGRKGARYTVYPPYALPMFAVFFEPGGFLQGVVLVELASLVSLGVIGSYGARELRFAGPALASVGALATGAIAGVVGCLWVGQFSLLCVALIVTQIVCLDRGRGGVAGLCWALAMLKPQIALAFAPLFMRDRQWRGLVVGGLVLAGLSLLACWWTGLSPWRVAHHWMFRESLTWTGKGGTFGPGKLAEAVGLKPRDVQLASLAACGAVGAVALWILRRRLSSVDLLPLAGACGLLGELLFYHRSYDHVMLAPAVFAVLARVAALPTPTSVALAVLVPGSVWMPSRFIEGLPHARLAMAAIWGVAAVVLVAWAFRVSPRRPADAVTGSAA